MNEEQRRPNRSDVDNCRWFRNGVNAYDAGAPFLSCASGAWVVGYRYAQQQKACEVPQ